MKIDRVAFTGADESVKPEDILRCVDDYPHVKTEWALLLSKSNEGKMPRYPALPWMQEFVNQAMKHVGDQKMTLAGHLQGRWLRGMCAGFGEFPIDRPTLWPYFQRIQLNFHGIKTTVEDAFYTELHDPKQFIFQMDGVNEAIYHKAREYNGIDIVPLYDLSAGEGISPESWPKPVHPDLNGYAGGIGPDNIKEELKRLADLGDVTIWIDMETKIRSDDNKKFELDRCRRVLDAVVGN